MENFDQIFTLIATKEGIGLNLDILETGLINIIALIGILIYAGNDLLMPVLAERNNTIIANVKDAENRLIEAETRLSEAQNQIEQARLMISEMQALTDGTKKIMLETDVFEAKEDLKSRFERALNAFKLKERQIFFEIKEQITSLVLSRTVNRVKETFTQQKPATDLINTTIRTLELP